MGLFKRKKKKEYVKFEDPKLENEFLRDDTVFKSIEDMQNIRTHCEQVVESSKFIEELKDEKKAVESYIMDIQKIENLPDNMKATLKKISNEIEQKEKKRQAIQDKPQSLSKSKYAKFERIESEFPKALINLQNDEKYCTAVKHDLRILEAEKISLKEDMESFSDRSVAVRNIAIVFLFAMIAVFMVFFFSNQLNSASGRTGFMLVMMGCVLLVGAIFFVQRRSLFQFKLSEKKLARTIRLLNKTKIKYVNIVNLVDYQHEKYNVKNAFQLAKEYEAYLNDKKKAEKYRESTRELDSSILSLNKMLDGLKLNDGAVWENQYTAFADEKEWKEIKGRLQYRHRMLNEQIEYNIERINASKAAVIAFVNKHPDKVKEVMEIVDSYDMDM